MGWMARIATSLLGIVPLALVPGQPLAQGRFEDLATFAERMCKDPPLETRSTKTELSASGKAEFSKVSHLRP